jgi:hypothetical protein
MLLPRRARQFRSLVKSVVHSSSSHNARAFGEIVIQHQPFIQPPTGRFPSFILPNSSIASLCSLVEKYFGQYGIVLDHITTPRDPASWSQRHSSYYLNLNTALQDLREKEAGTATTRHIAFMMGHDSSVPDRIECGLSRRAGNT